MTTNQTIDGVPRELLERIAEALNYSDPYSLEGELRALLDAPAGIDWKTAHDTVLAHHRETFAEHIAEIEELKAAQPQGEPVAEIASKYGDPEAFGERELITLKDISKFPYGTKLYAEQSAPVSVTRPAHANPPPGAEPSGTHSHNDGLDEMRKPR